MIQVKSFVASHGDEREAVDRAEKQANGLLRTLDPNAVRSVTAQTVIRVYQASDDYGAEEHTTHIITVVYLSEA